MKKVKVIFSTLVLAVTALFSSCASNNFEGNGNSVTLKVLQCYNPSSPSLKAEEKHIWDAFEKAHPNIKIERQSLDGSAYWAKLGECISGNNMPDVFFITPAGLGAGAHEREFVKDLTPFMKKDGIIDNYKKIAMEPSLQYGGFVAELPVSLMVTNCFIANKKVLAECGLKPAKTYEELKKQIPVLKAAGKDLVMMGNSYDWVMQSCLFSMILGRYNGEGWVNDVYSGRKNFKEPWFKNAVQMIKNMYDDGVIPRDSVYCDYSNVPNEFVKGNCAYLIDGDWRCGAFSEFEGQVTDLELVQFPELPGEVYHNSNSGVIGTGYGMSAAIESGSDKEKAAWELIKWLSGGTAQTLGLNYGLAGATLNTGVDYSHVGPIFMARDKWYDSNSMITPVFDSNFIADIYVVLNEKLWQMGAGQCSVDDVCNAVQRAFEAAQR